MLARRAHEGVGQDLALIEAGVSLAVPGPRVGDGGIGRLVFGDEPLFQAAARLVDDTSGLVAVGGCHLLVLALHNLRREQYFAFARLAPRHLCCPSAVTLLLQQGRQGFVSAWGSPPRDTPG
jgi:hypothetical protein